MEATGRKILQERLTVDDGPDDPPQVDKGKIAENDQYRIGFHVPPFNSVFHLHMHIVGMPCFD